jgi:hypothetical protein
MSMGNGDEFNTGANGERNDRSFEESGEANFEQGGFDANGPSNESDFARKGFNENEFFVRAAKYAAVTSIVFAVLFPFISFTERFFHFGR